MNDIKFVSLRVRKPYFDAIVKGEKKIEYRKYSDFWFKRLAINRLKGEKERIAVFLCGKRIHRRWIREVHHTRTPNNFSEQGRKDVNTPACFAIYLEDEARRPRVCPKCGSFDIGQVAPISSETNEEYEKLGGRWYCVTCAWVEDA